MVLGALSLVVSIIELGYRSPNAMTEVLLSALTLGVGTLVWAQSDRAPKPA
jgi:hypothetical protein